MQDFRNLEVWQEAHEISKRVYELTLSYPTDERFGLISQTRRAAVSIETNIAEGCGRSTDADFRRFLFMSQGSASETECLVLLAGDLNIISETDANVLIEAIQRNRRRISALIARLSHSQEPGAKS